YGEDLLPLLTTRADPVLFAARARIVDHAVRQWPDLDRDTVAEIADAAVPLTLSHVVLPAQPPETVGRLIARIVTRYRGEPAPCTAHRVGTRDTRSARPPGRARVGAPSRLLNRRHTAGPHVAAHPLAARPPPARPPETACHPPRHRPLRRSVRGEID